MRLPFKVVELDHVVLRCRDQARALDFYTRIIGLREERRVEPIGLIQLRAGAGMVDLIPATEPRVAAGANLDHFCLGLETNDLDATIAYLKEQGVEVLGEPATRYGARGAGPSVYIRDPEGNLVELKPLPLRSGNE